MTSAMSESAIESNKQCYYAKWKSQHNGAPLRITPLGNVVGEVCWPGATPSSMLYDFITDTSMGGLKNAVKYTGMTEQQRIDATAKALGLSRGEVKALVTEANKHGADVNWTAQSSTLPGAKPALTLSNKSNGIRAEWNKINGATKYIVYYKKNADSKWSSTETANTYYPLLKLAAGTQYAVQVQPVFGASKGLYSSVARLVYQPTGSTSSTPTPTMTRTGSNGLRVSWPAVSGADKYILYYKVESGAWSTFELPYTYADFTPMVKGVKYSFQLQPVKGGTKGAYSKVAAITY